MRNRFIRNFFRKDTTLRALKVAVVVGPVLIAINQLDLILQRQFTFTMLLKSVLTFIVPYCVSAYSSAKVYSATEAGESSNRKHSV